MKRRTFVNGVLAASVSTLATARSRAQQRRRRTRVFVIGAGAFGGWTALSLLRRGAEVTLVDAWGPGHSRSSSGGESRVIRHAYEQRIYVDMAKRSLDLWRQATANWGRPLYHESGVLHMTQAGSGTDVLNHAAELMSEAGVEYERLDRAELGRRYPQVNLDGIEFALFEPHAGYLLARRACEAVVDVFRREGGRFRQAWVRPGAILDGVLTGIEVPSGSFEVADRYVFACGPWLKTLFPNVLGERLEVSRQEVFYFGTPAGEYRYDAPTLPVWTDFGKKIWYGIPGGEHRGFKIADDTRGSPHDPSTTDREVSRFGVEAARNYIGERFPGLEDAPLIESRVCQYTNTPDGDFIADRHPHATNLCLLGGGSGHGFKHGPALGEMMAEQVLDRRPVEPTFALARFER